MSPKAKPRPQPAGSTLWLFERWQTQQFAEPHRLTATEPTPVLAGQYSFYAITQMFLFREGRRNNDAMIALAKPMTDTDLRGFSDFIGTLAPMPAPPPATSPDAVLMSKGQ